MTPVQFALVGAGGIAQAYAQAFAQRPAATTLVAVVDPRTDAAAALSAGAGCPAFASVTGLLADGPPIDAAVVCTPPNTHEAVVTQLLRAGVAVLCEKPFTRTPASARRMVGEARRAGVHLTMASKFRYAADVVAAKALVTAGTVGEVILFENAFTGRVDMSRRWNSDPAVSGGGVLIDNGTHSVDLTRYFLGPLSEVHAVEGKRVQGLPVEDTARLFVRSAAGVMGSVDLSWSIDKQLDWYVTIHGSAGTVRVGWKESRYKRAGDADWTVFGRGYDKVASFAAQLANFAGAIRGTEELVITADDAVASVDVIDAAYQSLANAPWQGVGPVAGLDLTRTPAPNFARPAGVIRA